MPNSPARKAPSTPSRISGAAPAKGQGVYADIARFRRQQTLTPDQLDPAKNSARRRRLYKTGQPTSPAGYSRVGRQA